MSAPGIVLVARGDDDPAVRASFDVVIGHLTSLRPDLKVGLGLLNSNTPTVHEAVTSLAATGIEEIAMVPGFGPKLAAAVHEAVSGTGGEAINLATGEVTST